MSETTRRLFLCALLSAMLAGNAPAWAEGGEGGEGSGGDGDGGGEGSGGEGSGGEGSGGEGSGSGDGGGEGSGGEGSGGGDGSGEGSGGEGSGGGDGGGEGSGGDDGHDDGNNGEGGSNHGPEHEEDAPDDSRSDRPGENKEDHETVRGARMRGEITSFDEVYATVRDRVKGDIIAVEIETRKGEIVYDMTVLGDDGRVMDVTVDARTSTITAIRER